MIGQGIVFIVLSASLVFFIVGRPRYDIVALFALIAVGVTGVVPAQDLFLGFGHPAVVTVAAILVVSKGLEYSGFVDTTIRLLRGVGDRITVQILVLTLIVAFLSGFMNNVGALALFMPVAIRMARSMQRPASIYLMPLAFGSLLGGLTTLIGTPPNIIISSYRQEQMGEAFGMFDFFPVGSVLTVLGVFFISFIGWRLLPRRSNMPERKDLFRIADYVTETRIRGDSRYVGKPMSEIESSAEDSCTVVGLIRDERHMPAPSGFDTIRKDDILLIQASSETIQQMINANDIEISEDAHLDEEYIKSEDVKVFEVIVTPNSPIVGLSASDLRLRWLHGLNLLAVARQSRQLNIRVGDIKFMPGDILLLHGNRKSYRRAVEEIGCLPLAERGFTIRDSKKALPAIGIFLASIVSVAFGLLPIQVSFAAGAALMVLLGIVPLQEAYDSIDWPVIVLLAAMIPVGQALEATGGANLIAGGIMGLTDDAPVYIILGILMTVTFILTNIVNNATCAVLMAPVAFNLASGLGYSPDACLMCVAVGSSAAFLTPIGHQSNTLVMGPGGYRFSDYVRMGLPLQLLTLIASIPLIMRFWSL